MIQLKDNRCYLGNPDAQSPTEILPTVDSRAFLANRNSILTIRFYLKGTEHSLNQAAASKTIYTKVNTALEIIAAFEEIDEENLQRVNKLWS